MSLLPFVLSDPWDYTLCPSRILDQHFGLALDPEDLFQPRNLNNSMLSRTPVGYLRNWRSFSSNVDSGSVVNFDKDKFQANLDVQQFKPEEISVKLTGDNVLTIEGKHEEKQDQHGYISRHFVRRYVLSKDCDISRIESTLSSDGVLSIVAPRANKMEADDHKSIPITQTGQPAKAVEQSKANSFGNGDHQKK